MPATALSLHIPIQINGLVNCQQFAAMQLPQPTSRNN